MVAPPITTVVPKGTVSPTTAVFQVGGWTYNQVGLKYNAVGTVYGGSDRRTDQGPKVQGVAIL